MAKLKSPLLSLGARGTIADALTYQKRGTGQIVRGKPVPRDPYSLNQAYQRWDYRDYAYLWTLLSESEKQVYRTKASRYHITGFSLWMREKLKDLPDLVGRWHLDEKSGVIVHDSSKGASNGTIFGASFADGRIAGCLDFDGNNDYVALGTSVQVSTAYTLKAWLNPETSVNFGIWRRAATFNSIPTQIEFSIDANDRPAIIHDREGTINYRIFTAGSIPAGRWSLVDLTWEDLNWKLFVNGEEIGVFSTTGTPANPPTGKPNFLGVAYYTVLAEGRIDEFCVYNRARNITENKRHSERRYPI